MFGLIQGVISSAAKEIDEFVDNPIKKTVGTVTQPVRDGLDILDGLTEGEIRHRAALRLGADVVAGMALSEVIDYLID